ncbi:polyketide biosynthesis 3-hydroxy-3-methylglutaryl-CoA synthase-like enzyme PksG [Actinopolyspora lacussalsi]|nr:polyketide biosynthesis 3-hydroxy-3-methylglutaryl-CoA synthase-like enzyme PksG [Actinopolyspora lacussalsi]
MGIGVEAINAYVGRASIDVRTLFRIRDLDTRRFENLQMHAKSVNLPCEDPVSNAVNAARPLLDELTEPQRESIRAVIIGTESGLDFGKPISTYVQQYLPVPRSCRSFEIKHACYGGTAALRTAIGLLTADPVGGGRALVIASDAASAVARDTYWEPSQGAGAVAMLVGEDARVMLPDAGAFGLCSYEVMDTLRPRPDLESGDSDLSLLSYLRCLEECWSGYRSRVPEADIRGTFDQLVLHTPFAGMVKGAHRTLLRKVGGASGDEIEEDFHLRVEHGLIHCRNVGNVYGAALYLALCSLLEYTADDAPRRVGMFSYGSGCASEFYSAVLPAGAGERVRRRGIGEAVTNRRPLEVPEYERISDLASNRMCGVRDHDGDTSAYETLYRDCFEGRGLLVLDGIEEFHRSYRWS